MTKRFIVLAQNEEYLALSKFNIGEANIEMYLIYNDISDIGDILEARKEWPFLIAFEQTNATQIVEYLNKHGVHYYIFIQEFIEFYRTNAFDIRERFWEEVDRNEEISNRYLVEITGKRLIQSAVLVVGTACSLKCKNCGDFNPITPLKFRRYRLVDIINSVRIFCKYVDFIPELQIQGGEPFLYTELDKLLDEIAKIKIIRRIVIATNGTVIPKDTVLHKIVEHSIKVRISEYEVSKESGRELANVLQKHGIEFSRYDFKKHSSMWFYLGGEEMHEADEKIAKERFFSCWMRPYVTIQGGIVEHCSRALNASVVQGFDLNERDIVLLNENDNDLGHKLRDYIIDPQPMTSCKYCYGTDDSRKCIPAEQLEIGRSIKHK